MELWNAWRIICCRISGIKWCFLTLFSYFFQESLSDTSESSVYAAVLYTAEHTRNTVSSRIEPSSLVPNAALLDVPDAAGRVLMAISLCLFGVRMLEFYAVSRLLGPKVLMVGRMVRICLFDFIKYMVYVCTRTKNP